MPIQEVLPDYTPNQGREIWNANDRSLLARIDSFAFNVKSIEYGAVGDGVNDDLPALQSAIDSCSRQGGGYVFLPTGTYLLQSGSLVLRDAVNIFGSGMFNSIIRLGNNLNQPVITDDGASLDRNSAFGRTHLANFAVDGNKSGNPNGQEGILTTAYFSIFENLLIHDCGTHGIRMGRSKLENASSQNQVSGCRIFDCNNAGVYLDVNSIDHNISGNYIYNCDIGLHIENGGVRVVNNDIYGHTSAAIEVEQTSYGLLIASNDFNGNSRQCIHVSRTNQLTPRTWSQFLIVGNTILGDGLEADNQFDAIYVETSVPSGISNLSILSNKIFTLDVGNRYRYGIHLEKNITDTRCTANHISRAGTAEYFVGPTCSNVVVDSFGGVPMLAPAMPASGEPMLNPFPVAVTIYLNEGLVRNVFIDAVSTGLTFGTFYLPAGKTITIVYDQAPAWNWLSA
jgi:hypothetical protein